MDKEETLSQSGSVSLTKQEKCSEKLKFWAKPVKR